MLSIKALKITRGTGAQQHCVTLPELSLSAGQVLAVTGESGCGKSTLLEAIGLLLKPEQADTFQLGDPRVDILQLNATNNDNALAEIRARYLGFVLQNGGLLPFLTVRDNIQLPRRLLGLTPTSDHVEHAIDVLKLEHLLNKLPQALSIGERQRVACIRAIAHEPQLLLADEPTAALDPHSAHRLFELFLELVTELKLSALVVSHDWSLVKEFELPTLHANCQPGVTSFVLSNK